MRVSARRASLVCSCSAVKAPVSSLREVKAAAGGSAPHVTVAPL